MKNKYSMTFRAAIAAATVVACVVGGMLISSPRARADSNNGNGNGEDLVEIGLKVAPVKLTYNKKDRDLVGLGSFIVNVQSDCNGCHVSDPTKEFKDGGNPYLNQYPTVINTDNYLAGGQDFGPVGGGIVGGKIGPGPDIITRNLTPNKDGVPEGGMSFADFLAIFRHGTDFDHVHPICSPTVKDNCYFFPPDGDLLQIMPWPKYRNMTDRQILAIYTYLSAISCIDNKTSTPPAGHPDELRNTCN